MLERQKTFKNSQGFFIILCPLKEHWFSAIDFQLLSATVDSTRSTLASYSIGVAEGLSRLGEGHQVT
jgi:hypothetical protein